MLPVIGQENPHAADKEAAAIPLGDPAIFPDLRFVLALMPGESHGGQLAACSIFIGRGHGSRSDLRMRRRSAGFGSQWSLELECPKWKVIPVAAQIAHGAVSKIPPAIPLWSWEVDRVEWPLRGGAKPQVPVKFRGNGLRLARPLGHPNDIVMPFGVLFILPTPGA